MAKAVGTKSINQIKNFYYDNKKQTGKLGGKLDQKDAANQKSKATDVTSKDEKNQKHDSIVSETVESADPNLNQQPHTPPRHLESSTQQAADVLQMIEQQRQQELLHLHRQKELVEQLHHNANGMVNEPERGGTSPVPGSGIVDSLLARTVDYPGTLKAKEVLQQYLNQQHTHNQQLELQLLHREQQLQQQRQQQQQHHPPQSALHEILARHHQREQPQQHANEEARRLLEHYSRQHGFSSPSFQQHLEAQNRMHHSQYAADHENGSKTDSQSELANIQRLLHLQQLQQNPMLALGQSNHDSQLSSLLRLAASPGSSGISPELLAQLESMNGANRQQSQADQQASEINALLHAQSLLGMSRGGVSGNPLYHGGGGNSRDGTQSPPNHLQHPGVSDAMALLHAMQRGNGGAQHGFGGPDRQG